MSAIDYWLSKQSKRNENFVSLFEGLFEKNGLPYVFYRLRFFGLSSIIVSSVHIIEFFIIYHFLGTNILVSLALLRGFCFIITGFYWGFLECLRSRIRILYAKHQISDIRQTINQWLRLSMLIGLAACLTYCVLFSILPARFSASEFVFYLTYSIAILAQLVLQLIVLTYHSGAFSIRRIARPILSISGSDILGLFILLILWPITHLYSLPISLLITQFFRLLMTYIYTKRTYLLLGIHEVKVSSHIKNISIFRGCLSREGILAGASNLVMRAEGLILILLFAFSSSSNPDHLLYFLFFFLISPFTKYSYDWVRLFYFDFKKLDRPLFKQLSKRLVIITRKYGPLIGLIFWIPVLIISQFFNHINSQLLMILCLFFMFRPIISIYQMHAFTEHRYWDAIVSGILSIAPLVCVIDADWSIQANLALLTSSQLLAIAYLIKVNTQPIKTYPKDKSPLPFFEWLSLLYTHNNSGSRIVYEFTFSHFMSHRQATQLASMISAKIADYGEITEFDSYHYLLQTNSNYMIDYQWMNEMSAGQIYDIQRFDIEDILPKQSIGKNKRLRLLRKYRRHKGIHWVSIIDPYNLPLDIDYFELQKATHKATITPLKLIKIGKYQLSITLSEKGIEQLVFIERSMISDNQLSLVENLIFQENVSSIRNAQ